MGWGAVGWEREAEPGAEVGGEGVMGELF